MDEAEQAEMLENYSQALDEIYRLRVAMAYEAQVLKVHLGYKSFPKSRWVYAEDSIRRMREAARGIAWAAYYHIVPSSARHAMQEAEAASTLTRSEWEQEVRNRPQLAVQFANAVLDGGTPDG